MNAEYIHNGVAIVEDNMVRGMLYYSFPDTRRYLPGTKPCPGVNKVCNAVMLEELVKLYQNRQFWAPIRFQHDPVITAIDSGSDDEASPSRSSS